MGLNLFQADDALTIVSEEYQNAEFDDNGIEYILSGDIYTGLITGYLTFLLKS